MTEQRKNDNDAAAFRIIKSVVLGIVALTVGYFYAEKNNSSISEVLKPIVGIIFIILATIMVLAVVIAIVSGLYELVHPLTKG